MGYYNRIVTGDALKMPYVLYQEQYSATPTFSFMGAAPEISYRHKAIRDIWVGWIYERVYLRQQTISGWLTEWKERTSTLAQAYLWPFVLGFPLLCGLLWLPNDRRLRYAAVTSGLFLAFMLPVTWHTSPHYVAPVFGLLILFLVQSLRRLRLCRWREKRVGAALTFGILVICIAWVGVFWARYAAYSQGNRVRVELAKHLEEQGGRHLVIVRYAASHNPHHEWVYNAADIDSARVVWAREMDAGRNRRLVEYFAERTAWLLQADDERPLLVPYPVN
jgi:hypothetical protein